MIIHGISFFVRLARLYFRTLSTMLDLALVDDYHKVVKLLPVFIIILNGTGIFFSKLTKKSYCESLSV